MIDPHKTKARLRKFAVYSVLIIWVFIVYFPLYWTVITSFKLPVAITQDVTYVPWVDFEPSLHAWKSLLGTPDTRAWVVRHFVNGLVVGVGSATAAVIIGALAAHGLARFRYKFGSWRNKEIAFWFVSNRMMPPVVVVFAFLVMYQFVGLVDTRLGLTLAFLAINIPLAVWLLKDFFARIPQEIEESALVDGASRLAIFVRISLPLAAPGLVATFILAFIFTWNGFLFPLILSFQESGTVPILMVSQVTNTGVQWWRMSVLAILSIIPSVIGAILLERRVESGLFSGGIK